MQQNDCSTKKRQNIKRKRYYENDSSDYDAESIEYNHCGYEKRKKRPAKKINIDDYDNGDDVNNDDDDDQSEIEKKKKEERYHDIRKTMNLVNLSI